MPPTARPASSGAGPPIARLERPGWRAVARTCVERAAPLTRRLHPASSPRDRRKLRVKELKKICDDEGIDIKGLTEKEEIVKKIHDKFGIKSEL